MEATMAMSTIDNVIKEVTSNDIVRGNGEMFIETSGGNISEDVNFQRNYVTENYYGNSDDRGTVYRYSAIATTIDILITVMQ